MTGRFTIKTRDGREEVLGAVIGGFGVHRGAERWDYTEWPVTHRASGLVFAYAQSKSDALRFARHAMSVLAAGDVEKDASGFLAAVRESTDDVLVDLYGGASRVPLLARGWEV